MHRHLAHLLLCLAATATLAAGDAPWPAPVAGWKPLEPGEHPRLIFRRDFVPELRKRAATPAGKVILERTRKLLDGPFTTWHPAGHAFLYQATGDKAHAAAALAAAEKAIGGAGNPDARYNFAKPGGQLRAGPVIAGMALAYDLAYEAWDEAARRKVAKAILDHPMTREMVDQPRHEVGCNHYGAHQGGTGVAMLALIGDPEADSAKAQGYLDQVLPRIKADIKGGFGERGFFYEGHHPGRISATGLIPFIAAYRNAVGMDLVANCPNVQWMLPKWIYDTKVHGEGILCPELGMYRTPEFWKKTDGKFHHLSSLGEFAQGWAICPDEFKPAAKWFYHNVYDRGDPKHYDVIDYPHFGAWALAYWPFEVESVDPDDYLPKVLHDPGPNYFVFRNKWEDETDLIVTAQMGSKPESGRGMAKGDSIWIAGPGIHHEFPGMFYSSRPTHILYAVDGSASISGVPIPGAKIHKGPAVDSLGAGPTCLAVDFSKASSADLLVVMVGPQAGHTVQYWKEAQPAEIKETAGKDGWGTKTTAITLGGQQGYALTLAKGGHPDIAVTGGTLTAGKQKVNLADGRLVLGTMAAVLLEPPVLPVLP